VRGEVLLGKKGTPVAIGNLERFAADYERDNNLVELPAVKPKNGKKVAIVGSGPSDSPCGRAHQGGFDVTVFEALHEAGGVLVYGIPNSVSPRRSSEKRSTTSKSSA